MKDGNVPIIVRAAQYLQGKTAPYLLHPLEFEGRSKPAPYGEPLTRN